MKNSPKILFMGTPKFAARALYALSEAGFSLVGVITQPDKNAGRGLSSDVSAVKEAANSLELPVFQPESKEELVDTVQKLQPELSIVAAYGMIIPKKALEVPKYGTLNIHGSLLPKYRGGSCVQEAILNDEKTGITIMEVAEKMDAGAIISQVEVPIEKDTAETLMAKLSEAGAKEIARVVPLWVSGEIKSTPQEEGLATYCKLIKKEDGKIDWSKPAEYIERMTRAYYPWPSAYTSLEGKQLKIISALVADKGLKPGEIAVEGGQLFVGTGEKALEIQRLQPEGKKEMSAKDFLNGNPGLHKKYFS